MAYGSRRRYRRSGNVFTTPPNYRSMGNSTFMYKPPSRPTKLSLPSAPSFKKAYKRPSASAGTQTMSKRRRRGPTRYRRSVVKFAGGFRKAKRSRGKRDKLYYNKHGSVFRLEDRGSLTSSESCYVGHSTVATAVIRVAIARAIVKKLFSIAGIEISNWDATEGTTAPTSHVNHIFWSYYPTTGTLSSHESPVVTNVEVAIAGSDTYGDIADNLAASWASTLTSATPHDFYQFTYRRVETGVAQRDMYARMFARDVFLDMRLTSALVVQNQTNATADGGGADEGDENPNNITANPLKVRQYKSGGWTSGLVPHTRGAGTGLTTSTGLVPDKDNGVITLTPTVATNLQPNLYKLPPPWMLLGVNHKRTAAKGKSSADVLQPGDIKKSFIKWNSSHSFSKLMNVMAAANTFNTKNFIIPVGNCAVFGFEHVLKMSGDTDILIGYQVDLSVSVACRYKKNQVSEPILQIN